MKQSFVQDKCILVIFSISYDIFVSGVQRLAGEAETRIEDTDPPLFLRFINLLINDAIFLLDEAFDVSRTVTVLKDDMSDLSRKETYSVRHVFVNLPLCYST